MEDTMSMTQKRVMPNDLRDFCGAAINRENRDTSHLFECGKTRPDPRPVTPGRLLLT